MSEDRFFVDENLLPIGRALELVRKDVVYPSHPRLASVPRGTLDHVWLPIVAKQGLVIITRDKKIRHKPIERRALLEAGARQFCLTTSGQSTLWDTLALLVRWWPAMEDELDKTGPWLRAITRSGLREIDLTVFQ